MRADKERRKEKAINSIVEACVVLTLALLTLLIFATFLNSHPLSPEEISQKKTLVDALLDRLKHHCITIRINGPSLRVPDEQQEQNTPT